MFHDSLIFIYDWHTFCEALEYFRTPKIQYRSSSNVFYLIVKYNTAVLHIIHSLFYKLF